MKVSPIYSNKYVECIAQDGYVLKILNSLDSQKHHVGKLAVVTSFISGGVMFDYFDAAHEYMGANNFLKLGGLELDSRGVRIFLKPPQFISKPPNFWWLGY